MSDETRDRIVEGAYQALVKGGYHVTSIKDIAQEAGVAPGLVHYYFETKEDLLIAAIQHGCLALESESKRYGLTGTEPAASEALEQARLGFELAKRDLRKHRGLFVLIFDMYGVGLHNPKIAAAVKESIQQRRALVESIVRGVMAGLTDRPEANPGAIAAAIWGGIHGITLQKVVDRNFDADAAIDALAEIVFAYGRQLERV